jgi:hypothetical protein
MSLLKKDRETEFVLETRRTLAVNYLFGRVIKLSGMATWVLTAVLRG